MDNLQTPLSSAQQFCLRWHNHQTSLLSSLPLLLDQSHLTDVTLSAEGRTVRAHRVVLSACSTFFSDLFRTLEPPYHPVVVLPGASFSALVALLTFMYSGEVNVYEEQIAGLLSLAETLGIKGLADFNGNVTKTSPKSGTPVPKETADTATQSSTSSSPQVGDKQSSASSAGASTPFEALFAKTFQFYPSIPLNFSHQLPSAATQSLCRSAAAAVSNDLAARYQTQYSANNSGGNGHGGGTGGTATGTNNNNNNNNNNNQNHSHHHHHKSDALLHSTGLVDENSNRKPFNLESKKAKMDMKRIDKIAEKLYLDSHQQSKATNHNNTSQSSVSQSAMSPSALKPPQSPAGPAGHHPYEHDHVPKTPEAAMSGSDQPPTTPTTFYAGGDLHHLATSDGLLGDKVVQPPTAAAANAKPANSKLYATCFICHKQLSNQYNLRVHLETHQNVRYACNVCTHVSRSKDALRKHVSYRHPGAPSPCESETRRKRAKAASLATAHAQGGAAIKQEFSEASPMDTHQQQQQQQQHHQQQYQRSLSQQQPPATATSDQSMLPSTQVTLVSPKLEKATTATGGAASLAIAATTNSTTNS